jgi:hypothetical protein
MNEAGDGEHILHQAHSMGVNIGVERADEIHPIFSSLLII